MKDNRTPLRNDDHKGRWLRVVIILIGIFVFGNFGIDILDGAMNYAEGTNKVMLYILGVSSLIVGILMCVKRRIIADFLFKLFGRE